MQAEDNTTRKRKSVNSTVRTGINPTADEKGASPRKKRRGPKAAKGKAVEARGWPVYFDELFKVFKVLNTVLAFCSSRKSLAVTFPVVRESAERLLKHPLDLSQVAELKALLPHLVKFAYIPRMQVQIHDSTNPSSSRRERSPDYARFGQNQSSAPQSESAVDEDEHVLVLDFEDNSRGRKPMANGLFAPPAALTPAATKKLIEKRNQRFEQAVNELLEATPPEEDAVSLLRAAARDHVPIDPSNKACVAQAIISASQSPSRVIPSPEKRPSIESVLAEIREQEWYIGQMAYERTVDAKDGQIGSLDDPLPDPIVQGLNDARNISSLYTHQVASINALNHGKHVIVSTSTASGKSVIYQVPLLRYILEDPMSTAIFIYPTKALAQDQKQALEQLIRACPGLESTKIATYDGDTPQEDRREIRETVSVIFTNFDMMHFSILPHEEQWRRFLKNIKVVAVDELHYYSGTFGSHVAQVLRRFRRICAAVGNRRVRFVSCSATITNPGKYMRQMFGVDDVEEITEDGAPSGRKDYVVWDAPPVDPLNPALGHQSTLQEATRLSRFLMERGIRLIVFCPIRKSCELFFKSLRAELTSHGRHDILDRVMSYRGGYTAADRRRIEREAFEGNLLGIVATNALELGVDIGVLDAVMMFGFPRGGIPSFRQQAGRAGRRARDALAVFMASDYPIDRHYVNHPQELFDKPINELAIDTESEVLLEAHLQCAGQEMPLSLEDEKYFGPVMRKICEAQLVKDKDGWYHTHPKFLPHPARHISLRGASEDEYAVVDVTRLGKPGGTARILEQMETSRALFELYEGAVFIHQGVTFIIKEVSHDSKLARLVRSDVNWTTEPRDFTNVDAAQTHRIREIRDSPHRAYYGRIELMTLVFGYFKIRAKTILDAVDVDTPPWEREANGFWIDVPKLTLKLMRAHGIHPAEAIHAAEHAFLNRFPLAADMGTECKPAEKEYKATPSQRKRPARLVFYERTGAAGGSATKAFDYVSSLLLKAHDTVEACDCEEGCAECVVSPSCRENNLVSSKRGALIVLKAILGLPIDEHLLIGPENPEIHETIVEATPVRVSQGVEVEHAD